MTWRTNLCISKSKSIFYLHITKFISKKNKIIIRKKGRKYFISYRSRKELLMRNRGRDNGNDFLTSSKRSVGVSVFVVLLLQNEDFCCNFAIKYQDYGENGLIDEFWVACDGNVEGNSCTYWCHLRSIPEQRSGFMLAS